MPFLLLIQNETKNAERENESKFTLCEEIYGTVDDWLGGEYLFAVSTQTEKLRFVCVCCDNCNNSNSQVLIHGLYAGSHLIYKKSYERGLFFSF